jgi:DNA-binding protein HU-beta
MNKAELINYIAQEENCTKTEAEKIIDVFTNSVIKALGAGNVINLIGFGSFSTSKVPGREGRNPKTGEALTIKSYVQPKFKAGLKLKNACNVV